MDVVLVRKAIKKNVEWYLRASVGTPSVARLVLENGVVCEAYIFQFFMRLGYVDSMASKFIEKYD